MKYKKIITLLLVVLTALCFPLTASAVGSGSITLPSADVSVGDEFTVNIDFTADSAIGTVQAQLSYSEEDMEFVGSDFAFGGGGLLNIQGFPGTDTDEFSVELKFKALRGGSSTLSLSNGSIMSMDGISLGSSLSDSAEITLGVSDSTASADDSSMPDTPQPSGAQLSSLTVTAGELRPAFSPGIYNYTVTVSEDTEYIETEGVLENPLDGIWYEGSNYLGYGHTPLTITVTSADGSVENVYSIDVYRPMPEQSGDEQSVPDAEQTFSESGAAITEADPESVVPADTPISENAEAVTLSSSTASKTDRAEKDSNSSLTKVYAAMAVVLIAAVFVFFLIVNKTKNRLK